MSGVWHGLIDDAALFPPEEKPMSSAVPAHRGHLVAWYSDLVGPFVVPVSRVGEFAVLPGAGPADVALTVPGGTDALTAALDTVAAHEQVRLAAVELPLREGRAVAGQIADLDRVLPAGVRGSVELPRGPLDPRLVDALSDSRHQAKFRTGGTSAQAFPGEEELAGAISACAGRRLPFKCTAGLHHAVRHTDPKTGFEHHGFVNVLLATAAALDGASTEAVAAVLAVRTQGWLAEQVVALGESGISGVRGVFTSVGSCSVQDPVDDMVAMGLPGLVHDARR